MELEFDNRLELYEGLWSRLKDIGGRLGDRMEMMAADKQGKTEILVKKYGEVVKEIDSLATLGSKPDSFEMFKGEINKLPALKLQASQIMMDINKLDKNIAAEIQAQSEASQRDIQRRMDANSLKYAAETLGLKPEDLFKVDLTLAGSPGAAGNPKGGKDFSNSDRESDLQSVFNTFRQKVDLDGDGKLSADEKKKADKDGDGDMDAKDIIALLVSLGVKDKNILSQIVGKLGLGSEEQQGGEDNQQQGEEEKKSRPIRVRTIQRPIINVVQRVARAEGVDMSVQQAEDIAVAITRNLVNQMRANGVEFRGVNKDLKESFINQVKEIISEESLSSKLGSSKQKLSASDLEDVKGMNQRKKGQIGRMAGAIDPADYIKLAKAVIQKYDRMSLGNRKAMKELEKSDNPDEFVDFYDVFMDIKKLQKYFTATLKLADEKEKETIQSFKKKITAMAGMYQRNTGFTGKSTAREFRKKFVKMKKEIKGMGKKEKSSRKRYVNGKS